jgi:hypothetical protein
MAGGGPGTALLCRLGLASGMGGPGRAGPGRRRSRECEWDWENGGGVVLGVEGCKRRSATPPTAEGQERRHLFISPLPPSHPTPPPHHHPSFSSLLLFAPLLAGSGPA